MIFRLNCIKLEKACHWQYCISLKQEKRKAYKVRDSLLQKEILYDIFVLHFFYCILVVLVVFICCKYFCIFFCLNFVFSFSNNYKDLGGGAEWAAILC